MHVFIALLNSPPLQNMSFKIKEQSLPPITFADDCIKVVSLKDSHDVSIIKKLIARMKEAIDLEKDTGNNATNETLTTLRDEFCSDESFGTTNDEQLVEKILVTADCQADWSDKVVTKLLDEKLNEIGIKMKSIKVNRNVRKCFESCLVTIQPMQKKLIELLY